MELMLTKIKSLAVTVLHDGVHMKQLPSETVKSFITTVKGTAVNCRLTKTC